MSERPVTLRSWNLLPTQPVLQSLFVGFVVMGLCIVGIHTQVLFSLASVWPANAALLALLIVKPETNRPLTWLAATVAYLLADLLAGSDMSRSVLLTLANLAGVAVGAMVFRLMPTGVTKIREPADAMHLIAIMGAAAGGATVVGGIIAVMLLGMEYWEGIYFWFASELVNYAVIMPVAFAFVMQEDRPARTDRRGALPDMNQVAALGALVVSLGALHAWGRVGGIAFPIPALVWCAVCFRPVTAMLITAMTCSWLLFAAPLGLIPLHGHLDETAALASLRLGVAMIAIAPFTVAALNAAWLGAHRRLHFAASHDAMTGLFNRGAFVERANNALSLRSPGDDMCLLMVDIDHFKAINDTHGHGVGDQVITELGRMLRESLRSDDLVGRVGGEEFAIVLPRTSETAGEIIAERIRHGAQSLTIRARDGAVVPVTVSIGLAVTISGDDLSSLMSVADTALYEAKRGGRNRLQRAEREYEGVAAQVAAARAKWSRGGAITFTPARRRRNFDL